MITGEEIILSRNLISWAIRLAPESEEPPM